MRSMQLSYAQIPRRKLDFMDLDEVLNFVSPRVREAVLQASAQLKSLNVRFALVGGLAVGAHGYVRATEDVHFLVGDEAFEKHGMLVTFKPGMPIKVGGVRIDYLSPASLGEHLVSALEHKKEASGIEVVSLEHLIYMKLIAKRRKDLLDVVELLKRTSKSRMIRNYLEKHAADLVPLFDELLQESSE